MDEKEKQRNTKELHLESRLVHEGSSLGQDEFNSIAYPICLSTTFVNRELQSEQQFQYTRSDNPTRKRLENCLASLEKAEFSCVFASGSAAMDAICEAVVPRFGKLLASSDLYGGSHRYLRHEEQKGTFSLQYVDFTDSFALTRAIESSEQIHAVWIESCTNPLLKLVDFHAVSKQVKSKFPNCIVIVDNTFLTPFLVNPLDEQETVDLVCHSVTKYLNGHCDVLMGAICTKKAQLYKKIRHFQNAIGNVPSPFDCFLTLRGLKTFALRMERQCENALKIALFLRSHPKVLQVIYPNLPQPNNPQWEEVRRKILKKGFGGGMLGVRVAGNAVSFVKRLRIFLVAESLGGVESLVEIPALMTHAALTAEERRLIGISDDLVRISVGIEHIQDLIGDLEQALALQ